MRRGGPRLWPEASSRGFAFEYQPIRFEEDAPIEKVWRFPTTSPIGNSGLYDETRRIRLTCMEGQRVEAAAERVPTEFVASLAGKTSVASRRYGKF